MANRLALLQTPLPIHYKAYARNRQLVNPGVIQTVNAGLLHTVAYRKKMVFIKVAATLEEQLPTWAAVSTDETWWHVKFRTGYSPTGTTTMRGAILATGNDDAYCYWKKESGGGSDFDYAYVENDTWGNYTLHFSDLEVTSNTDHEFALHVVDDATAYWAALWETPADAFCDDTQDGVVAANAAEGGQLIASETASMLQEGTNLWQKNGQVIATWARPDKPSSATTITNGTYINAIDGTSAYNATTSPGFRVQLLNHCTRRKSTVPVRIHYRVHVDNTDPVTEGRFTLYNGTDYIEDVAFSETSETWHTFTGTMDGTANTEKWDPQIKRKTGAGNVYIHAITIEEYEA